jgi:4-hydroxy-3-methylbut-2-en-1-yl diphosphate synthase IspG/GcpE
MKELDEAYAYYREPIDCPECGRATHELYQMINEGEQPTLMCDDCINNEVIDRMRLTF